MEEGMLCAVCGEAMNGRTVMLAEAEEVEESNLHNRVAHTYHSEHGKVVMFFHPLCFGQTFDEMCRGEVDFAGDFMVWDAPSLGEALSSP